MASRSKPDIVSGKGVAAWSARCPNCQIIITAQAVVDDFLQPPGWIFWGSAGRRWKLCEGEIGGYTYTHFAVNVNGNRLHRLAWQKKKEPVATQGKLW